jgi:hypothetical protein
MNKSRVIGLLSIVLVTLLVSGFNDKLFTFWANNIRNNREVINEKPKTVVIITKSLECSGCEKMVGEYFEKITQDTTCGLVIIAENNENVLLRRSRVDYLKSVFKNSDKVLFSNFSTDSIGVNKLSNYSRNDFPIVALIDNKSRYFEGFIFESIAKTSKWGISPRKEFERKVKDFLLKK